MSDWQIGDLAVCVQDWPEAVACGIVAGKAYGVAGVYVSPRTGNVGLVLAGVVVPRPHNSTNARHFRKIRPDTHEPCEEEFVTLLKRGKVSA